MKKIIFLIYLVISFLSFSDETLITYKNYDKPNLKRDTLLAKEFSTNFDNFVYVKYNSNVRAQTNRESDIVTKLVNGSKVEALSLVLTDDNRTWFKIKDNNENIGYLDASLAIKREFNYEKAIELSEKVNDFIKKYKWKIKIISKFKPLDNTILNEEDILGNFANQSVTVYTDEAKSNLYNLPDRAMFTIIGENDEYYLIKSPYYDETLYMPKSNKEYFLNSGLGKNVNKFIFIDKDSQTEIALELGENNTFNLITSSFVTTGINSKYGFETPTGMFLVAITKPKMFYFKDGSTEEINGEAKFAIRFSGGAYIHGIPSLYEPEENINERIEITKSLIGSFGISHKCVRNYDEVVSELYNWVGYKKILDGNLRIPKENTIVIVE
ncbi:L,D-transpeptidase family protein [Oceanivirga miroungae]|uniref:ErfK/YbiS/YcfS/YnhG family protein n=1 Tax=Oceanivirga miroungae TaxID=1130046 RepID=A0A6I8MCA7_9FUSO|nr:L,D-transpeptidase family protein [Oceanivirga miroungae]VWL85882.1 ErfK/YbiS/YcfS/YnhG family protein [Oceanivirga miroungae]